MENLLYNFKATSTESFIKLKQSSWISSSHGEKYVIFRVVAPLVR
jgi:hypothetical protein